MSHLTSRTGKILLALVFAVVGVAGFVQFGTSAPAGAADQNTHSAVHVVQAPCGDTSGFAKVALSSLPPEATDTVNLIKSGGPFPYPGKDGSVFTNVEGILPACQAGYYHEYTVITPGAPTRGTRRIITGGGGEYFYTGDHYKTFSVVNVNAEANNRHLVFGEASGTSWLDTAHWRLPLV
ncbi:MAG: ribonuclease [Kutzneria sp.]|nr:ribonuclease [Kutzneria sp.]